MKLIFYNPQTNEICTLLSGHFWDGENHIGNVSPTSLIFWGWELIGEL